MEEMKISDLEHTDLGCIRLLIKKEAARQERMWTGENLPHWKYFYQVAGNIVLGRWFDHLEESLELSLSLQQKKGILAAIAEDAGALRLILGYMEDGKE